jgi:hypothetical protein
MKENTKKKKGNSRKNNIQSLDSLGERSQENSEKRKANTMRGEKRHKKNKTPPARLLRIPPPLFEPFLFLASDIS